MRVNSQNTAIMHFMELVENQLRELLKVDENKKATCLDVSSEPLGLIYPPGTEIIVEVANLPKRRRCHRG